MRIQYDSNNSGGSWWLQDKDWLALKKAGWTLHDYKYTVGKYEKSDKLYNAVSYWDKGHKGVYRYLGAIARSAHKDFETPGEAMREFEKITGQSVTDEGCSCCGAPHMFYWGRAIDDTLPEEAEYGYASGESCAKYMFDEKVPANYRDALEEIERLKRKKG